MLTPKELQIDVPVKPSSAVCPWCDQEAYVAYVSGTPTIIKGCLHAKGLGPSRPIAVQFMNMEVGFCE